MPSLELCPNLLSGRCRKVFYRSLVLMFLAVTLFIASDLFSVPPTLPCGLILLGGVTSSSIIVFVKGCVDENDAPIVLLRLRDNALIASTTPDLRFPEKERDESSWLGSFEFRQLDPKENYQATYRGNRVKVKTFPDETMNVDNLLLTFGSCSSLTSFPWNSLSSAFRKLQEIKPDMSLFLGDNVYTDVHEKLPWYRTSFNTAYTRLLAEPMVQQLLQTTPSFSILDDHEIENDFNGVNHPLAEEGIQAYIKYTGQRNPGRSRDPLKLYYWFDYGRLASVFVIEARTQYNPDEGRLFGENQRQALLSWLERGALNNFTHLIIASPLSWSTDGHGDTFARDREEVFDAVTKLRICNVLILSGDMHFGAAYRHAKGRVMEFSASPFQAFPFWPDPDAQNNVSTGYERLFIHGGLHFYFGALTLKADGNGRFDLYRWPLFHRQREPKVFEVLPFSNSC